MLLATLAKRMDRLQSTELPKMNLLALAESSQRNAATNA
jgi:hypothetical protein